MHARWYIRLANKPKTCLVEKELEKLAPQNHKENIEPARASCLPGVTPPTVMCLRLTVIHALTDTRYRPRVNRYQVCANVRQQPCAYGHTLTFKC